MAFKGRCFGCHKRGHMKAQCNLQKRVKSTLSLQDLPVEVIELICAFLMDDFVVPWAFRLHELRLTCRTLNRKTLNIFAAAAFRRRIVKVDSGGLQRLLNISKSPIMARQVESLLLVESSQMSLEEYSNAEREMLSQDLPREERENAMIVVLRAYKVLDDKDYMQRSGYDSILLSAALQNLPNLQEVTIDCVDRRNDRASVKRRLVSNGETTAHIFSMLSACLPFAKSNLLRLRLRHSSTSTTDEALSLQALSLPPSAGACFCKLQFLNLYLQMRDDHYRNPFSWHNNAANFLSMCSGLQEFQLSFRNDWVETERVFAAIAEIFILPHLKKLSLQLIRCEGVHLHRFLSNHRSLRSLFLKNLDITGSTPFTKSLELLQHQHNLLSEFKFEQIAQNSMRLYLATLGQIETHPFWPVPAEEDLTFFHDFLEISRPSKYHGIAEEWEGVPGRIGRLKDDVRISDLDYHSDVDAHVYWWVD